MQPDFDIGDDECCVTSAGKRVSDHASPLLKDINIGVPEQAQPSEIHFSEERGLGIPRAHATESQGICYYAIRTFL